MLNPNLADFWFKDGVPSEENFIKVRNRVLYGGRGSSKSHEYAGMSAMLAANYQTRFLCVRRFQNKIKDSVYTLICDKIEKNKTDGFRVLTSEIRHQNGSEFAFYGIERNTDEIKSFEGADVLWIEEAHNLTAEQWAILEPTIRKQNSEIWISFNPDLITDFVYQRFIVNPPKNTRVRLVNYPDNPFLSQTMLDVIAEVKESDPETYRHIYLGEPRTDDDQAVIKLSWINSAIDAHKLLPEIATGRSRLGFDIADSGEDSCATITAKGGLVIALDEWRAGEDESLKSSSRAFATAAKNQCLIVYDSIGVGASAGSHFKGINAKTAPSNRLQFQAFNAGAKVFKPKAEYELKIKNEDFFANLKAQSWWLIADRLKLTHQVVEAIKAGKEPPKYKPGELIAIDSGLSKLEQLKAELATPHRDFDNYGRVKVESKKDLAKRGIKSPNLADAFIMAFAPIQAGIKINAGMLR